MPRVSEQNTASPPARPPFHYHSTVPVRSRGMAGVVGSFIVHLSSIIIRVSIIARVYGRMTGNEISPNVSVRARGRTTTCMEHGPAINTPPQHNTKALLPSILPQYHLTMHTVWVRLNAVVFFGLTVLLGLSCLAAISKIGHSVSNQPSKRNLQTFCPFRSTSQFIVC